MITHEKCAKYNFVAPLIKCWFGAIFINKFMFRVYFFFYFKKLWNIKNDVLNTETITENSLISLSQDDIASPKICFFKLLSWGGDERVFKMCKTRFGEGLKMFIFIWRDLILNLKKNKKKSDISSSFHVFLANIHLTFSSPLFSDSPHFSFRNSSTSTQDVCLLMVF